ncbi:MAG: hypothetical protein WD981_01195 [Gaiellaceae bacterium]
MVELALGQGERPHPDADDPSRTRVSRLFPRCRRTGEEKLPGQRAGVDGVSDEVPGFGHALPLVDQDRRLLRSDQSSGVALDDRALSRIRQAVDSPRAGQRGPRLADRLCALERDRREGRQKLVELVVDDARKVGGVVDSAKVTRARHDNSPFRAQLSIHFARSWGTIPQSGR